MREEPNCIIRGEKKGFKSGCVKEKIKTGEDGSQKGGGRKVDRMARELRVREEFSFGAKKKTSTVKTENGLLLSLFHSFAHARAHAHG